MSVIVVVDVATAVNNAACARKLPPLLWASTRVRSDRHR